MSKLSKLKEWLTIGEAAKYLSDVFGEHVSELDVLRFAKDRHLRISVLLVNTCMARACPIIPTEQAKTAPSLDGTYNVILGYPISMTEVISLDGPLIKLRGVWDLPMLRGDIDSVEEKLLELANGPKLEMWNLHGVFVTNTDGDLFQILCDFADTVEYKSKAEGKDIYDRSRYFEAVRLPDDSMLVIRTEAINEFENYVKETPTKSFKETPKQRRERITSYVDKAHAKGIEKTVSFAELAEIEGCRYDNITRIYYRKDSLK